MSPVSIILNFGGAKSTHLDSQNDLQNYSMNASLKSIHLRLLNLGRLERLVFIFILGLLSGLAMPPINLWWIFGITIPLFLVVAEKSSRPFLLGWVFGIGYFIAVLHWIGFAFFVDAKTDLWMMPFAVGGLAGAAAVYWGLANWLAAKLARRGFQIWLSFPLCLSIAEWLRGILLTGFPWAVPGLAADGMGAVEQLASIIGMNGLTLLLLVWAATPFAFIQGHKKSACALIMILPLAWGWGEWRLQHNPTQFVAGVGVRLVQPNISQSDKWRGSNARAIFDQLVALSSKPSTKDFAITHIIWPESSIPFLIDESAEGKAELRPMLIGGKFLLAGAVRRSSPKPVDGVAPHYFTSVMVFNSAAEVVATYDKWHLVPGGEYLPFESLLEPLGFRKVVPIPESFTAGPGPQTISIPGAGPASLQICYEDIFANSAIDSSHRPDWIVNVTNDGWFGNSVGPYQHIAQLRLRAIEQGLPVARSANTGVSAIIDPVGRYIESSQLGVETTTDSRIPAKIQPTVYSIWGDFALLGLFFLGFIVNRLTRTDV
jgi:apolipoprotein N-acyltransferase